MKKTNPNFEKLIPLLRSNEEFSLTEKQYKEKTGADLPKENYYLKTNPHWLNLQKIMVL